ncbi:MAG: synthase delta subunit [Pseudomonadota bacterium]|jgi:F-type H+-transporting ATPase subunit delta
MIVLRTQARPYANALFELSLEEETIESWHRVLSLLATVIQNEDVQEMLRVRSIDSKEWVTWIQSLKPELLNHPTVGNFLSLLAEKRRLHLLPQIHALFEEQWRKSKHEQRFSVTSPTKWDKAQAKTFSDFLEKRFDCQAEVVFKTDPAMLGGVAVEGEGWSLDCSVKGWLAQLRAELSTT